MVSQFVFAPSVVWDFAKAFCTCVFVRTPLTFRTVRMYHCIPVSKLRLHAPFCENAGTVPSSVGFTTFLKSSAYLLGAAQLWIIFLFQFSLSSKLIRFFRFPTLRLRSILPVSHSITISWAPVMSPLILQPCDSATCSQRLPWNL